MSNSDKRAPSNTEDLDVTVVGAGVIGLSIAWKAAAAGLSVAIVDPAPGMGTTWVAAGMLAAVTEAAHGDEPVTTLAISSLALWPTFAHELVATSGIDIDYDTSGILHVGVTAGDRALLWDLHQLHEHLGLQSKWLATEELRELEPGLSPAVRSGLFAPGDHKVDNRLLLASLREACLRLHATFIEQSATRVVVEGHKLLGVELRSDTGSLELLRARQVVLAAGLATPSLLSASFPDLSREENLPIRPVKGDILRLHALGDGAQLPISRTVRGFVRARSCYLVPRSSGELVLGATMQESPKDDAPWAGSVREMLSDATEIVPGTDELAFVEANSRSRPGTPDNCPYVDRWPSAPELIIAAGHYRNGILQAPLTAQVATALLTQPPGADRAATDSGTQVPEHMRITRSRSFLSPPSRVH